MLDSQRVRIAPSILAADFAKLGEEVAAVAEAGADWIHIDVMDGHFVPNLTLGPQVVRAIRDHADLRFDTHLMVAPADPFLAGFAAAGADSISVHPESGPHLRRSLQTIAKLGKRAGVVLNPATPVAAIDPVLDLVDLVLVMSVNPGRGGQTFIPAALGKLRAARARIDARVAAGGRPIDLEVDGGINLETAPLAREAGADVLVAGTAIFNGHPATYAETIRALRHGGLS